MESELSERRMLCSRTDTTFSLLQNSNKVLKVHWVIWCDAEIRKMVVTKKKHNSSTNISNINNNTKKSSRFSSNNSRGGNNNNDKQQKFQQQQQRQQQKQQQQHKQTIATTSDNKCNNNNTEKGYNYIGVLCQYSLLVWPSSLFTKIFLLPLHCAKRVYFWIKWKISKLEPLNKLAI